jgi:dTDP-4-dehydrorhamnose 3,5-epimerase
MPMQASANFKVKQTSLSGVLLLEPRVFGDDRGFFFESYNQHSMAEAGITDQFIQDNHSYSAMNVLRGLHYQLRNVQAKLVRVVSGEILDVAVDLRRTSSTFGQYCKAVLSGDNKLMFYIPRGFAHGFLVRSPSAHVLYKSSDFYDPESERVIVWSDPELAIDWEVQGQPVLSAKDSAAGRFREAEVFE